MLCISYYMPNEWRFYLTVRTAEQTVHEGRIYQLKLFCGKDYPDNPPTVRFQTRINMSCVNLETGVVSTDIYGGLLCLLTCYSRCGLTNNFQVEPNRFPMLSNWKRECTMEDILIQLKKEMMSPQNRKLSQPPDGPSLLICFFVDELEIYDSYFITLFSCLFPFIAVNCGLRDAFSIEMLWNCLLNQRILLNFVQEPCCSCLAVYYLIIFIKFIDLLFTGNEDARLEKGIVIRCCIL